MNSEEAQEVLPNLFYYSKIDHRNNAPKKSQWIIEKFEELSCFEYSIECCWNQVKYTSWGLYIPNGQVEYLGESAKNESTSYQLFIAKFVDSNKNNYWHGYPANPSSGKKQDIPPEFVLKDWQVKNHLRLTTIRKITKGQKCKLPL